MVTSDGVGEPPVGRRDEATVRELVPWYAGYIVIGAVRPRAVYFKGFLRGRALARHTGWTSLVIFATSQWVRPWARRKQARTEAAREQLADELGREPTTIEVMEKLGYST